MESTNNLHFRVPRNKGKLVGQKAPLKPKEVWAIRIRLQMERHTRDLALFDLGIDSKLRGCDLVKLRVGDICHGDRAANRATVRQQKTQRPVHLEITAPTREAVESWIKKAALKADDFLFPSRTQRSPAPRYPSVRPDVGPVGCRDRVGSGGLRDALYATHKRR